MDSVGYEDGKKDGEVSSMSPLQVFFLILLRFTRKLQNKKKLKMEETSQLSSDLIWVNKERLSQKIPYFHLFAP